MKFNDIEILNFYAKIIASNYFSNNQSYVRPTPPLGEPSDMDEFHHHDALHL